MIPYVRYASGEEGGTHVCTRYKRPDPLGSAFVVGFEPHSGSKYYYVLPIPPMLAN